MALNGTISKTDGNIVLLQKRRLNEIHEIDFFIKNVSIYTFGHYVRESFTCWKLLSDRSTELLLRSSDIQ